MDLIAVAEVGMLLLGVYFGYNIFVGYTTIKTSREIYENNKILLFLSLIGVLGFILSFQVYWLSEFYEKHKYFDIFIKIVLSIFSLINQMFLYDMDEEEFNAKKRKGEVSGPYFRESKLKFQVVNRLLLLYIAYKIFNRNNE